MEVDLRDRHAASEFFDSERPQLVIDAAARVGHILANSTSRADFLSDNLRIQVNLLDAAQAHGVERLPFLGSSCVYPRFATQPIREDALLTGALDPTNHAYTSAKIAGILQVQAILRQHGLHYISAMPTNLYGPGDNFDAENCDILPALIRLFHEAKQSATPKVVCWGSGTPRRQFLHVDDLARACLFLLENYHGPPHIIVGVGEDKTISDIAQMVAYVVGFTGTIEWDPSEPDCAPRKLLDVSRINELGRKAERRLLDGLRDTYAWSIEHIADGRR